MKNQKLPLLIVVFVLIAGTASVLSWLKSHQRLGEPGIRSTPVPGSVVRKIDLPERVLDFTSTNVPQSDVVLNYMPKDTSFAQRYYWAPDGFAAVANIILMGADRTSIHKPDYCLPGQGWTILRRDEVNLPIAGPAPYSMPVAKWTAGKVEEINGTKREVRAIYVFWFVADNEQTAKNDQRIWWQTRDLLRKRVLQRWAYVSYFAWCVPGQEDATFDRMSKLIAASVPEFQRPPSTAEAPAIARQ